MGCDIHLHTEVKIDGKWHHYGTPSVNRNYGLFAKMAGVRNYPEWEIDPIDEPRGLPGDITELTEFDSNRWGVDGHSHSWLSADEIAKLVEWQMGQKDRPVDRFGMTGFWESEQFGYLFGNNWSGFAKYPNERVVGLEDVRFVFWFDN